VVLPFANLSGDPAQDCLADSLTDELTTSLARVPGSFVIARNTAFTYKGKPADAKAIGKDLGVRYVLEGSVQPSGNQVRVNAQLIDADSGAHLWADQFDTSHANVLQTQDEIVMRLRHAMFLQLTEVEAARVKRAPAANPGAEDLSLQCEAAFLKTVATPEDAEAGFRLCEQALAADPNNVRALTFLSLKFLPSLGRGTNPKDDPKHADELLSKALALDPNYGATHIFKALRERMRCSSLIDWPVYPRLAHTMRASNGAQCGRLGVAARSCLWSAMVRAAWASRALAPFARLSRPADADRRPTASHCG
jgi:adenylate cyclase